MGFYGNTIYNTYGLQDKSVQPRHLDRNYWRWGRQVAVQSIQMLRKNVLNLPAIGINNFTQSNWDDCWKEAEKSVFAFHFNSNSKDNTKDYSTELRSLFGAGLNIGWVIKESKGSKSVYCLYFMALGDRNRLTTNRPGSIFKLELNPNGYTEDSHLSDYANYKDSCESNWSNKYLVGPILSDAHLLTNSVTTEKIRDLNVTEPKMAEKSVSTRTIQGDAVKPSKLDRDYWERTVWNSIESYKTLFENCTPIPINGEEEISDTVKNQGTLYVVRSLKLFLPSKYTIFEDDNFLCYSDEKYDFGQCFVQNNDDIITITSGTNGQIWTIEKVTTSSTSETVTDEGVYYKPILKQVSTPQVADRSISTIKIAHLAVKGGTDSTSIIDGYTVTSYNIKPYTITGEADSNHCNIAEKTITAYNIADETISPDKFDRDYWEYDFSDSLNTIEDLADFLKTKDKLFRFWIPYDSELKNYISYGPCVAIRKNGLGTDLGHLIINYRDLTVWTFKYNEMNPANSTIVNENKKYFWNKSFREVCYNIKDVCIAIQPYTSQTPTLGIIEIRLIPNLPDGTYFGFSSEYYEDNVITQKVFLISQSSGKSYLITQQKRQSDGHIVFSDVMELGNDNNYQYISEFFTGTDADGTVTSQTVNVSLDTNITYNIGPAFSKESFLCLTNGTLITDNGHDQKTIIKFKTHITDDNSDMYIVNQTTYPVILIPSSGQSVKIDKGMNQTLSKNSIIYMEIVFCKNVYICRFLTTGTLIDTGDYTVNFFAITGFGSDNESDPWLWTTESVLEGTTPSYFRPVFNFQNWDGNWYDADGKVYDFYTPITKDTNIYIHFLNR